MNRIGILGLVLLSQLAPFVFAEPAPAAKVRLAVIDLSVGDGLTDEEGKLLTVFIRDAIVNSGKFEVMDRQRVLDVLKEQNFSAAFTDETTRLVKMGKLLDANRIVGGRVGRFGRNWSLVLSLVDVNLGTLISSYAVPDAGSKENLLNSAPRAGLALVAVAEFIKAVGVLPPAEQVKAVIEKLKELNPRFDSKEHHKIEGGAVTELSFSSVGVTDISPLRALNRLSKLTMMPTAPNQNGAVGDLFALQGLPLKGLWCNGNPITDLSPLRGMPLTVLSCGGTQITDLLPLSGMRLSVLSVNDTTVTDLSPLEGMPLTVFWCNNTRVTDLSAIKAAPLRELKCDFVAERDVSILRSMKMLAKINDMPAGAFWMRVGAAGAPPANRGRSGKTSGALPMQERQPKSVDDGFVREVSALPPDEQLARVMAKIKQLNPGIPCEETHSVEDGAVAEFSLIVTGGEHTDISPLRAFVRLRHFTCINHHRSPGSRPLLDLNPLRGLALTKINVRRMTIDDLRPLRGMPLVELDFAGSRVVDFSGIQGLQLKRVTLASNTSSLAPLAGMPIEWLRCDGTPVRDLSPLKGMPLTWLLCNDSQVSDLSALQETPLRILRCDAKVAKQNAKVLQSIKTLQKINDLPPAKFLASVGNP